MQETQLDVARPRSVLAATALPYSSFSSFARATASVRWVTCSLP